MGGVVMMANSSMYTNSLDVLNLFCPTYKTGTWDWVGRK